MLSISELKKYHFNPPIIGLKREPSIQEKYDKQMVEKKHLSCFLDKINSQLDCNDYYLCENDFPYWCEDGIKHLLCWYRGDMKKQMEIYNELKTTFNIISCWKNLSINCSIKQIHHLHIFITN